MIRPDSGRIRLIPTAGVIPTKPWEGVGRVTPEPIPPARPARGCAAPPCGRQQPPPNCPAPDPELQLHRPSVGHPRPPPAVSVRTPSGSDFMDLRTQRPAEPIPGYRLVGRLGSG